MEPEEELKFLEVDIHYNYMFDIGYPVNPIDAARNILETELGKAFRNYVSGKSEIGKTYRPWAKGVKEFLSIKEDYEKIKNNDSLSLKNYIGLYLRNPRLLQTLPRILLETIRGQEGDKSTEDELDGEELDSDGFLDSTSLHIADLLGSYASY